MKKIIIAALTIVLILGICILPVSAAGNGSLSISGAEGKQGDTVTVAVNLSSNPGLITMKFAISYPSDLELLSVSNSGLLGGWTNPAPTISSPYTIRWADSLATTNNTATGKIVTLTFKIKDSATPGSKTISLTFNESRDAEGGKNTFGNASATIKVNCKAHNFGNYTRLDDVQHGRTCTACGYVEKANHGWNNGIVDKQPNCKETGEKTYTCGICNATKVEILPKTTNHNYSEWSNANSSTHSRTCSICQAVDSAEHDWDNGTITQPGSCKEDEEKLYTCSTCNAGSLVCIGKDFFAHKYGGWITVNDTTHKHTCSVCSKEETANHTWNSGAVTKAASCKEAGVKTYICTACNATKTEPIAKLTTHTYDHACDIDCNVCGETRTINHKYKTTWSKDRNNHWHECSVCEDKKDVAIHTPGAEATETTAQTCTTCGYVIKAALGHKHNFATTWTVDNEGHWYACVGCEEKGSYAAHEFENACDPDCSICSYTRETQHEFAEVWITDTDNHWHKCSGCGIKQDEASHEPGAEATNTTAQTCTICGYEIAPALGVTETEPTTTPSEPAPTSPEPTESIDNENENFPWWIILVVAVVIVGGIVAFVIIKKKKD